MSVPIRQVQAEVKRVPRLDSSVSKALKEVTQLLDEENVPHVVFGGIASSALGRPRTTRDIDVLVRPDGALAALELLARHGYETDRLDDQWIYKAQKAGVVVDIIFKTRFGIYLDEEMLEHATTARFNGTSFSCIAPEDLFIAKAIACDEASMRHWFDALGLLLTCEFDWAYLVQRAKCGQRRVLSLLLYAQSIDYFIPQRVIRTLSDRVLEGY